MHSGRAVRAVLVFLVPYVLGGCMRPLARRLDGIGQQLVLTNQQLAQTNLRSEIGKIDLDRTFEERTNINREVVAEVDKASEAWGVKVLRYEIKNITPPHDVRSGLRILKYSTPSTPTCTLSFVMQTCSGTSSAISLSECL